ncbi:adenine phosphoribosyltransferase [Phocoenobacter skyensis]|uniref:Adenine phosphoribosyltransferase n=1 Tax=Phocoenobacter skyensis TaxID=97481 RepID=A0A1H7U3K4_9PAST|nr:adenine phosphoribosyltransferase [Pasteurella skyensis]MDP8078736.1 adenine phosphoribosyltransferase [Pasteurella skyensis]MDP8084731.1 adenine phosphoribosyltransferase [Pasteurella skyensis]MDP8163111.1 adenine phosphoribosyltransferase [Pasteurella skyensis]MDP8170199.1 adenine phosphoribosyltransferase [Pasteurella skyensis]MDP8173068.1 adenine phosphoribosyltransferase [Pasteurella skyensis]
MNQKIELVKSSIKSIPNYPKEGIIFRDITSLLEVPEAFQVTVDMIVEAFKDKGITKIVGTESRGFIFGAPIALALELPFILVRKPNKLPREVVSQSYELEYGQDTLEIHTDAIEESDNVLIIDDLLATGGTVEATGKLIRRLGGKVENAAFVIGLPALQGAERLQKMGIKSMTIIDFDGH